ncbi:hypothetical protein [Roseimicrobium sp. ORNL1]|uniref:hypothetical protein n=1 Tax=Roseimicrobium sp. ORNL1 TaxID=2711231 RepID=UPI0013E1DC6E|nr:hypothetical protein [Roseimicrobium sp. ORNL1]QIF00394.1 hypothetical protein G5S37_02245 [Roseimicrobium sp. ORNL1]
MNITSISSKKNTLLNLCIAALLSGGSALAGESTPATETRLPRTGAESILTVRPTGADTPRVTDQENPRGLPEKLPDLVPVYFTGWRSDYSDEELHWDGPVNYYETDVAVTNLGEADAPWFYGYFKFKVLETADPVNWGVGSSAYCGNAAFLSGIDALDTVFATYCGWNGFYLPRCVTKAEVVFIADKYFKYLGGTPEHGAIVESSELNNVSEPLIITQEVE